MNPPPEKKKLLDAVLRESASGEVAANDSAAELPSFLTQAVRDRRRQKMKQRAAATTGVALALIGLGFIALHRTRPTANKEIAQARIHETVTSAPKVRTRKFQAAVVKTKDHKPLPKVAPHPETAVQIVTTEPWRSKTRVGPSTDIPGVDSMSDLSSLVMGQVLIATVETEPSHLDLVEDAEPTSPWLSYVTTTRGNYHVLDDADLLARLAPRAMMLTRDPSGEEHLVFLNSKDENSLHLSKPKG
jgi:hypothetical protein